GHGADTAPAPHTQFLAATHCLARPAYRGSLNPYNNGSSHSPDVSPRGSHAHAIPPWHAEGAREQPAREAVRARPERRAGPAGGTPTGGRVRPANGRHAAVPVGALPGPPDRARRRSGFGRLGAAATKGRARAAPARGLSTARCAPAPRR